MSFIPKPHEIYKHFKGNLYQIVTIAQHSETGEQLVIYQALYGDFKTYARELSMFTGPVDKVKYPDAKQELRFELFTGEPLADSIQPVSEPEPTTATKQPAPEPTTATKQPAPEPEPAAVTKQSAAMPDEEEPNLDPMIIQFLDANTYEEKLNILAGLHHRITQDMITTMAVASDVEIGDGELEDRYSQLKTCLLTLEKYECNRMR